MMVVGGGSAAAAAADGVTDDIAMDAVLNVSKRALASKHEPSHEALSGESRASGISGG